MKGEDLLRSLHTFPRESRCQDSQAAGRKCAADFPIRLSATSTSTTTIGLLARQPTSSFPTF